MLQLKNNQTVYAFSEKNEPVLTAKSGDQIVIETLDCFANQLRNPEDTLEELDWDRTNPATGPVYFEDAEPGDTLKITIDRIKLDEKGVMVSGKDFGTLGHLLEGSHTKIIPVSGGIAHFSDEIKVPLNPMIGVIGVAPADGREINTGTPGHHGGNMDNVMVTEGAQLYFPVAVKGALFAMGDLHAAMGDGEIGVTGLEIPAEVTITAEVIKGKAKAEPMLENKDAWTVIASRETLDEAAQAATEEMFAFLKDRVSMTEAELVMLMSLAGQVEICQIVDPLKTVRFVMPKAYIRGVKF